MFSHARVVDVLRALSKALAANSGLFEKRLLVGWDDGAARSRVVSAEARNSDVWLKCDRYGALTCRELVDEIYAMAQLKDINHDSRLRV